MPKTASALYLLVTIFPAWSQIQDPWALGDASRRLMLERVRTDLLASGGAAASLPVAPALRELLERKQAELPKAQLDAYWAKENAKQAHASATIAILQETYHTERIKMEAETKRRTALNILAAAEQWKPGNTFDRVAAPISGLEDPFMPKGKSKSASDEAPGNDWISKLAKLGLGWDAEHKVVRIAEPSQEFWSSVWIKPELGDYPILEDGSLLDSASSLGIFLKDLANKSTPIVVMRGDSVVILRVEGSQK